MSDRPSDKPLPPMGSPPPKSARLISILTLCVCIAGFGIVCYLLNLSLRNNTQQNMDHFTMELDKVFVDHPELTAYIRGTNTISPGNTNYERAVAAALMTLDAFDAISRQNNQGSNLWIHPDPRNIWIFDNLYNSPFLFAQLHSNANLYPVLTNYFIPVNSRNAER